jgi:hypothetical protein
VGEVPELFECFSGICVVIVEKLSSDEVEKPVFTCRRPLDTMEDKYEWKWLSAPDEAETLKERGYLRATEMEES